MAASAGAAGISNNVVKIGVLTDMSGVYSAIGGEGSVTAAKMAVADFGGKVLGKKIEIISADHQNKADIASTKAREWADTDHVDMIIGLLNSGCALAVQKIGTDKKMVTIATGAGSTALTNKDCSPYGIHYVYDTYALPKVAASAIIDHGGKTWFFLTADYAFGHSLEENTAAFVKKHGGKVLGQVRHPLATSDFSSYLLQAQASGAKVIGLANAGGDFINAVKQAREFGIVQGGQTIAGMLVFLSDVKSLGLDVAQGMEFATAFYWDRNDASRAWSQALLRQDRRHADHEPGRCLFGHHELPQGDQGRRHRQCRRCRQDPAGDEDRRLLLRQRPSAPRRHHGPRHVPGRSEEARRIEGPLGSAQGHQTGAGRRGLHADVRGHLSFGYEEVTRSRP